jgi:hypothetical protein
MFTAVNKVKIYPLIFRNYNIIKYRAQEYLIWKRVKFTLYERRI